MFSFTLLHIFFNQWKSSEIQCWHSCDFIMSFAVFVVFFFKASAPENFLAILAITVKNVNT